MSILPVSANADDDISAHSAIVYEPLTGTVLFEKNADERMLIASTTKIMTALVVLENCGLDEKVNVTREHTLVEGSSMYLRAGGDYTVRDLLYGMMLVSGNDAAAALADHAAGNMSDFAGLMNQRAELMGLKNTRFANSHGLDAETHYSSSRDMAVITAEAMKNETFCEVFACPSYMCGEVVYYNHNKLLKKCDGCIGGKTGYTMSAGRTLVSAVERDGMTLVCVTISAPDDWNDHMKLYDAAFSDYYFVPCLDETSDKIAVISGTSEFVRLRAEPAGFVLPCSQQVQKTTFLPAFVFAPVICGDRAGTVKLLVNGEEYAEASVYYANTVLTDESNRLTPWERLKRAWYLSRGMGIYYPVN